MRVSFSDFKIARVVLAIILLVPFVFAFTLTNKRIGYSRSEHCREEVLEHCRVISEQLDRSIVLLKKKKSSKNILKRLTSIYKKEKKHYKEIEHFVAYNSPFEARNFMNGPLPSNNVDRSIKVVSHGFIALEEQLFTEGMFKKETYLAECELLKEKFKKLEEDYSTIQLSEQN